MNCNSVRSGRSDGAKKEMTPVQGSPRMREREAAKGKRGRGNNQRAPQKKPGENAKENGMAWTRGKDMRDAGIDRA